MRDEYWHKDVISLTHVLIVTQFNPGVSVSSDKNQRFFLFTFVNKSSGVLVNRIENDACFYNFALDLDSIQFNSS